MRALSQSRSRPKPRHGVNDQELLLGIQDDERKVTPEVEVFEEVCTPEGANAKKTTWHVPQARAVDHHTSSRRKASREAPANILAAGTDVVMMVGSPVPAGARGSRLSLHVHRELAAQIWSAITSSEAERICPKSSWLRPQTRFLRAICHISWAL
jgi:hypothetical protein